MHLSAAGRGGAVLGDRAPLVNFASASHLGLEAGGWLGAAGGRALAGWPLATGLPRSIATDEPTRCLEREVAAFVGAEAAMVGPSTLHLLLDTVGALAGCQGVVAIPRRAYTLSSVAATRARGAGCAVVRFDPADPGRLQTRLRAFPRRPVVILAASVMYPGEPFPLRPLIDLAEASGLFVVVDDTLAMGVYGKREGSGPYGVGGGGGLLWNGLRPSGRVLQVASLTKGFSVPLAFVAADRRALACVARRATLLGASSPADLATVQAARWALEANAASGEALRRSLRDTVTLLRDRAGLDGSGAYPVLSAYFRDRRDAVRTGDRLLELGVWGLLQAAPPERSSSAAALRFNISAAHAGPLAARALQAFRRTADEGLFASQKPIRRAS